VLSTWPQYSGGAVGIDATSKPHVHLNIFRYFLVHRPLLLLAS